VVGLHVEIASDNAVAQYQKRTILTLQHMMLGSFLTACEFLKHPDA
jgi:hypothetical protein